ncbi:hypothetical protein E7Z59_02535 [Robertkochia marina]|uniref:Uncharacterized protein n=1 Tax=Robertkochia marina TaxID=1227945 RepID=A0A4S3M4U2_9FLAO|nr:hypothetical protein [Robertkochia marina]THD69227.1 hypothetical protein E7Z59_02535 [Robertkochia marina]TRZ47514.1 hypothetical protein D3A96_02065 [Robertkochia marina]
MKKKIESELVKIAHRILNMQGKEDIEDLKREARLAYENLTLLSFLETHIQPSKQVEIRNEIAERFETLAGSVLRGNSNVPETNPHEHEDDLMTPGMQTIRDMVKEMPDPESLEDILAGFGVEPDFVKRDKEIITADLDVKEKVQTKMPAPAVETRSKSKGGLSIGLNDKISFIKYLFNGSDEDYARVISQLNTKGSFEEAYSFLNEMVKPDYNNWEGQEIYEARLIKILEARFA